MISSDQRKEESKNQVPPFLFVLKEGPEFEKNLLDYSLCMMQIKPESFKNSNQKIIVSSRNKYDSQVG